MNIKQAFRVNYTNSSGQSATYDPEFKKIKSLFYTVSCSQVQPNQTTITAPPCQITNHTISFSNVQWGTAFESPQLCFGSITSYEYQLPSGWSIGSNVSNGSNWIPGGNNVTVTSDLSTGDGMTINVRPANSCGSGLSNGQNHGQIYILRPKPSLTFAGGYTVCTSQDFQANNVPSWVTNYTWVVTPNTIFGNTNSTSNPTTVTKLFDGEGNIELTISSTSCPLSFVYNTQEITGKPKLVAGKPLVQSAQSLMLYNSPGDENEVCLNEENVFDFTTGTGSTTNWSYDSHSGSPQPSWTAWGNEDLYVNFFKSTQNTLVLKMDVTNACGTNTYDFGFKAVDCGAYMFSVSPNPATSDVTVKALNQNTSIREIRIIDKSGNIKKKISYGKGLAAISMNISSLPNDVYIIQIFDGKSWVSKQIIKQ